jgi:hypothetical protein
MPALLRLLFGVLTLVAIGRQFGIHLAAGCHVVDFFYSLEPAAGGRGRLNLSRL